jgi:hypothetical protein
MIALPGGEQVQGRKIVGGHRRDPRKRVGHVGAELDFFGLGCAERQALKHVRADHLSVVQPGVGETFSFSQHNILMNVHSGKKCEAVVHVCLPPSRSVAEFSLYFSTLTGVLHKTTGPRNIPAWLPGHREPTIRTHPDGRFHCAEQRCVGAEASRGLGRRLLPGFWDGVFQNVIPFFCAQSMHTCPSPFLIDLFPRRFSLHIWQDPAARLWRRSS